MSNSVSFMMGWDVLTVVDGDAVPVPVGTWDLTVEGDMIVAERTDWH